MFIVNVPIYILVKPRTASHHGVYPVDGFTSKYIATSLHTSTASYKRKINRHFPLKIIFKGSVRTFHTGDFHDIAEKRPIKLVFCTNLPITLCTSTIVSHPSTQKSFAQILNHSVNHLPPPHHPHTHPPTHSSPILAIRLLSLRLSLL